MYIDSFVSRRYSWLTPRAQHALRDFLKQKGLFVSRSQPLLDQAPNDHVTMFEQDGHPAPDRNDIKLDWMTLLATSPWNKMAIGFLAEAFLEGLQRGDYPTVKYNPKSMGMSSIIKLV